MPIVKTFDLQDFKREFEIYNRRDQFSDNALELIFDYLDQCYSDSSFEMDVISICCEFQEMTCADVHEAYDVGFYDDETDDSIWIDAARDYINDNTSLVGEYTNNDGTVIFVFVSF